MTFQITNGFVLFIIGISGIAIMFVIILIHIIRAKQEYRKLLKRLDSIYKIHE